MNRRALLAGLPLLLAGCGSVLPKPTAPPTLYRLTPLPEAAAAGPQIEAQLAVAVPTASAALDTPRIALTRGAYGFDYFADAAWTDRAPALVESLLVQSLENAGRIRVVGGPSGEMRPDMALVSDLRRFQAAYDGAGPPKVEIWLDCRLVRLPDLEVPAVRSFRASASASANDIAAIVAAFDAALHDALRDLPDWVAATLAAPRAGARR